MPRTTKTKIKSVVDQGDVLDMLKADDKFKQYRRIVKTIKESIDLDKLDTELRNLHAGRSSRRLYGKTPSADALINASLQDSSNRSRMAEIRVEVTRQLGILEVATSTIKKHILNEFREHTVGLRTKGERVAFADQYLVRGLQFQDQLSNFTTRADFLIKDIDQTGFALRNALQCLELIYQKNSGASRTNI
jgi:hypothetical protein